MSKVHVILVCRLGINSETFILSPCTDIVGEAKEKICTVLARHRKLDDSVFRLFAADEGESLRIIDCAGL